MLVPASLQAGAVVNFGVLANTLPGNDDASTGLVSLNIDGAGGINLFGTTATQLYVNNNGNVTFTNPWARSRPVLFRRLDPPSSRRSLPTSIPA